MKVIKESLSGYQKGDKDYLIRSLNESSYGGAYDIEDDQFFTRDDIDEFAYEIEDKLNANPELGKKYRLAGVYMETPKDLYISFVDEDGYESYNTFPIDMRKIRKPNDLNRYIETVMNWFVNDFNKEYEWERRVNNESLDESKEVLYVIKDSHGNQLSRPNPDDNEL